MCRPEGAGPAAGALGLDLGGSSAKLALVDARGVLLADETVPMGDAAEAPVALTPIMAAVERLRAQARARGLPITALGCGVPGFLDATRRQVLVNNIAALDGFPLAAWLHDRTGLDIVLDNDGCLAALAEVAHLGRSDARRVLVVTVGSGIGVVLVVDGVIVRLHHQETGEAGHLIVDPTGSERCPVGCRGCLETVASARAIARAGERAAHDGGSPVLARLRAEQGEVSSAAVTTAAEAGDAQAVAIIHQAGRWLGLGLASWAPIYAPDLVLLGGGVAQAGPAWLVAATAALHEVGYPFFVRHVVVRRATLGSRAGMIGAALAAQHTTSAVQLMAT